MKYIMFLVVVILVVMAFAYVTLKMEFNNQRMNDSKEVVKDSIIYVRQYQPKHPLVRIHETNLF